MFLLLANPRKIVPALAVVSFLASWTFGEWNLPYPQPAKYDYSKYYSNDIAVMATNNPAYFKDKLAARWNFFKSNFIMGNGMVNHSRLDQNNKVIGTNEAVSEGQGYGMLLAVLNNDQATFNKIFQGSNTNLWNNGTKTYFCWQWSGGCTQQGAATDADLDIALALVFADKLVTQKYWAAYTNPDYKTRAIECIRAIRTRMCDGGNYLLPGDNWGGGGPQNPSYYAVAWMKVFNNYCKANNVSDVDYTQVISNCYSVLSKVRYYSKGQAPDWCNTGGGQEGGRSYGMTSDGIRTPWRIAMDALWFNDTRAIAYCKNIKGTLSQYSNSNANQLIAQMGQYSDQAQIIPDTYRCNEIGLWMTGALGSMETAFQKGVFRQNVLFAMQGEYSFFGSPTYSDDKFYFKQATAGLAYAAFTGQFPDMWDDPFTGVKDNVAQKIKPRTPRVACENGIVTIGPAPALVQKITLYSLKGETIKGRESKTLSSSGSAAFVPDHPLRPGTYILSFIHADGERSPLPAAVRFIAP